MVFGIHPSKELKLVVEQSHQSQRGLGGAGDGIHPVLRLRVWRGSNNDSLLNRLIPCDHPPFELVGKPLFFNARPQAWGFLLLKKLNIDDFLKIG